MSYRYKKYSPTNGIFNVTCDATGGRESIWQLPDEVLNLSKSRLEFNLRIPANNIDQRWTYTFKDVISPIRQIQLYTDSGIILCDIQYFNNYTKVARKPFTSLDEFLTYPIFNGSYVNGQYTGGSGNFLMRNNCRSDQEIQNLVGVNGAQDEITRISASWIGLRSDNFLSSVDYTEPQYFESMIGYLENDAEEYFDVPDFGLNISIELSAIKNTIFTLNKDIFFNNKKIFLKITWESSQKIAFTTDNSTEPATNPGEYPDDLNILLNNVTLVLATQQNDEINKNIKNTILTNGLNLTIDFISFLRSPVNTNGSTITLKYTRGNGRKIKYILVSLFNNNETLNNCYDCSNVATDVEESYYPYAPDPPPDPPIPNPNIYSEEYGSKIESFVTTLNDVRLQDQAIDSTKNDDYVYLREDLKKSVIQSIGVYAYNWVWIENFCGVPPIENNNDIDKGISLDVGQKYEFNGNLHVNNLIYYVWTVTNKLLTINKYGITCV